MASMNAELYDALLEAGASEDRSRKAAETLAAFEGRFSKVEQDATSRTSGVEQRFSKTDVDIGAFRGDVTNRFAEVTARFAKVDVELAAIRGELNLLKWMIGFVLAGIGALVVRGLF